MRGQEKWKEKKKESWGRISAPFHTCVLQAWTRCIEQSQKSPSPLSLFFGFVPQAPIVCLSHKNPLRRIHSGEQATITHACQAPSLPWDQMRRLPIKVFTTNNTGFSSGGGSGRINVRGQI